MTKPAGSDESGTSARARYVRRHLRFGWWSLLCFATIGLCLEVMHALKLGLYLDVQNETRRLLWTLGHAHGVLLGLVHVAFAATLHAGFGEAKRLAVASPCLIAASILLPGGFLLGGVIVYGGDPGLPVFIVPFGAAGLLAAVFLTARSIDR